MSYPLRLLHTKQSQLFQPFVIREILQSIIIFMAVCWTHSSTSMCLLQWGAQNWMWHSSCVLTSAEWRGRTTSLVLLVTLPLMHPCTPITLFATVTHLCLMFNLVSSRTLSSFPSRWPPACPWCLGLFLLRCRTLHFPLWKCLIWMFPSNASIWLFLLKKEFTFRLLWGGY